MPFLSLYRKYRPRSFADLVGQRHVVRTLMNALENNRIAHAYLFAGPRGTGKTSTAKIYAQALNCVHGPTAEPCGECESCQKIISGQSIDVIEIDAASNRGIDEIRDLREKVKFYPSEGKYKVYIIDEVHMLTKGAFNALLKTLEEPPESVVFILATTEPQKVIDTIMSRCQRFDFTLLSSRDILERLEYICQQEGVSFDEEALSLIGTAAKGGLRDAISLLDQAISFTNSNLNLAEIEEMLGKVDDTVLREFITNLLQKDSPTVLEMIKEIIDSGKGISTFVQDLIEFLRQVMLFKECGRDSEVFKFPEGTIANIEQIAGLTDTRMIIRFMGILSKVERELTYSTQPRIVLELAAIKMTHLETDNSLEGLTGRVAALERQFNKLLQSKSIIKDRTIEAVPDRGVVSKLDQGIQSAVNDDSNSASDAGNNSVSKERSISSDEHLSSSSHVVSNSSNSEDPSVSRNETRQEQGNSSLDYGDIEGSWPDIMNRLKEESVSVHALMIEGRPLNVDGDTIFIQFPEDKGFHRKNAERQAALIRKVISQVMKQNLEIVFISESEGSPKKKIETSAAPEINKSNNIEQNNNLVDRVVKAFNGKIIKVNHEIIDR